VRHDSMARRDEPRRDVEFNETLDATYRVSLVIKGLDGVLETIGGILLLTLSGDMEPVGAEPVRPRAVGGSG
jgi:uncharacterized membrane protein